MEQSLANTSELIFCLKIQVFAWPTLDYEFNSIEERDEAIFQADYIAENNLPLGLEVWRDKVFISVPKWKEGVPATLSTVSKFSDSKSPKLKPYPNWQWHRAGQQRSIQPRQRNNSNFNHDFR